MAMKTKLELATIGRAKANATIQSQAVDGGADRWTAALIACLPTQEEARRQRRKASPPH